MQMFKCDNPDHDHDVMSKVDTVTVNVILSDAEETQTSVGHFCVDAGDSLQGSLESAGLKFTSQ